MIQSKKLKAVIGLALFSCSVSLAAPIVPPDGTENTVTGILVNENYLAVVDLSRPECKTLPGLFENASCVSETLQLTEGGVILSEFLKIEKTLKSSTGHLVQLQGGTEVGENGTKIFVIYDIEVL